MAASSITVIVQPWVPVYVALMMRCGFTPRMRQTVVDFVCERGMRWS